MTLQRSWLLYLRLMKTSTDGEEEASLTNKVKSHKVFLFRVTHLKPNPLVGNYCVRDDSDEQQVRAWSINHAYRENQKFLSPTVEPANLPQWDLEILSFPICMINAPCSYLGRSVGYQWVFSGKIWDYICDVRDKRQVLWVSIARLTRIAARGEGQQRILSNKIRDGRRQWPAFQISRTALQTLSGGMQANLKYSLAIIWEPQLTRDDSKNHYISFSFGVQFNSS